MEATGRLWFFYHKLDVQFDWNPQELNSQFDVFFT